MCSQCGCGCPDSANCNCASFKTAASFANTVGKKYVDHEKVQNGRGATRVPVGKRGSKPIGKR